jgi:hypothetical protein
MFYLLVLTTSTGGKKRPQIELCTVGTLLDMDFSKFINGMRFTEDLNSLEG